MDEGFERELRNMAGAHPLTRLEAIHDLGERLRAELDGWIDAAELAQVRVARTDFKRGTWQEIGKALGVSHTQAQRRFKDRL